MVPNLVNAIADLQEEEALRITKAKLDSGEEPSRILEDSRKAMEIVGKGGGFVMGAGGALDEAKPENMRAMVDFTKEYGVYR